MRTFYAVAWVVWIGVFFVIEGAALATGHPQDTLSDFAWRLEHLHRAWTFARFMVAAGCLWLFFHLVFGWFR